MYPFTLQKKLFKAYDIRGEGDLFSSNFLYALAHSFKNLYLDINARQVVIGHDVRHYSQRIAKYLAHTLQSANINIVWLGQVTTPIMAFIANLYQGHGIIATASHSEKHIHGIKWLVNHQSPSHHDIQALYQNMLDFPVTTPPPNFTKTIDTYLLPIMPSFENYQSAILQTFDTINQNFQQNNYPSYHLILDCMNGTTGSFAKNLFEKMGYTCTILNDAPNGDFPKGNPDPAEAGRLAELSQAVINHQADLGLAFDGDGDRLMIVGKNGQLISPDHLLALLARVALEEKPTSITSQNLSTEIIFDVKCSHHLPELIKKYHGKPVIEKTGSSLMRKALQCQTQQAIFAGELSGHFLFNDGYFMLHDDAMYAGLRLLNWLKRQPISLTEIIKELPTSISTADIYLPITTAENGQIFVNQLIAKSQNIFSTVTDFSIKNITTIDGLRLDFNNGFGILRKSNTGNFLTVRFSGNTLTDLQHIQAIFVKLCQSIDNDIANQIAKIQPTYSS